MKALDLARKVREMVGDRAQAEVMVDLGRLALTRFANSFIHQNVAEDRLAVRLRVSADRRSAQGTTTSATDESLQALVDGLLEVMRLQPEDPHWPGLAPPDPLDGAGNYDQATADATPADRAAVVAEFVAAGPGALAAGYCDTELVDRAFANSAGQEVEGQATRATVDGIHRLEASAGSGHASSHRLADLSGARQGGLAMDRARRGLDAYDLKPGEYEVVLGPECLGSIAIFLGFYGFNGKQVVEGQSFIQPETEQFDKQIDLVDDPLGETAIGVPFDVEGTPKRRIPLIQKGVTVGPIHDRRSARRAGGLTTGHAVPGGETYGPVPTDLVFGDGPDSVEEMIGSVERGLYVATFNYCRVLDPRTLVVTGLTRNGTFMIEHGEITGAITNLRFTQSFVEALGEGRVLGIGNDLRHADSEFGAALVRAPSMHLASWNFTGGAAG